MGKPDKLEQIGHRTEKEVRFPESMDMELVGEWADGIPAYAEADPNSPEWKNTPIIPIDLSSEGYGEVNIKNEADRSANPTGTIKDRAAWELATLYRDYARALYLKMKIGSLTKDDIRHKPIPRLSFITSGNEGRAVAECFKQYNLPPPKLILDQDVSPRILEELKKLRADIYSVDLSQELTGDEIKAISNNANGVDITSVQALNPQAIFYDWHVHEAFNFEPDKIFVPYGSGRLAENYLHWQMRSMRNEGNNTRDPRLRVNVGKVISMDVVAAEPMSPDSIADKLTAKFKPFLLFRDSDIEALSRMEFTGNGSSKTKVEDSRILEAYEILKRHGISAEPSGAASLASYLDYYDRGLIKPGEKILAVNTGEGLTDTEETIRESVQKTLSRSE